MAEEINPWSDPAHPEFGERVAKVLREGGTRRAEELCAAVGRSLSGAFAKPPMIGTEAYTRQQIENATK